MSKLIEVIDNLKAQRDQILASPYFTKPRSKSEANAFNSQLDMVEENLENYENKINILNKRAI